MIVGLLKKAASGVLAIFFVLTYCQYAPREKIAVALLDELF